jgi:hypothetical protein
MLRSDLELVVQYPEGGSYTCRGFKGLHPSVPAYVLCEGAKTSDQGAANEIGEAFCEQILQLAGVIEETRMPCSGMARNGCHAMDEPTCKKILVRAAATGGAPGSWSAPWATDVWQGKGRQDSTWEILPAMPQGSDASKNIPPAAQAINACFWIATAAEVAWPLMHRVGLAPEESRIFISYVRKDASPVADQIFSELTQLGFDVFLDRCSVPVGTPFQERLMQDLCDKAMVVLLNSPNVSNSHWVSEELAIAKMYRLGLLELRFPGVSERPDVDPDFSHELEKRDFEPAGPDYSGAAERLSSIAVTNVLARIKEIHTRALHRRRWELIDNFAAALSKAGKTATVLADGTFLVPGSHNVGSRVIGLSVRSPELAEFCTLHQRAGVSPSRPGWLLSPAPMFIAQRQAQVSWLGTLSNIQHLNEAQISTLVQSL